MHREREQPGMSRRAPNQRPYRALGGTLGDRPDHAVRETVLDMTPAQYAGAKERRVLPAEDQGWARWPDSRSSAHVRANFAWLAVTGAGR